MSSDVAPLHAVGRRVRVDTVVEQDIPSYRRAVEASVERIRPWNPVNPHDLSFHLGHQSDTHRTFIIRALPEHRVGDHDIVGKVNLTGITRGRALAGMLGYDSYDPYAGRGLFAEGLRLVVDVAFASAPHGVGLNRVEAAVQPGNVRSAGLLRSIGFRRRGDYPAYLWLGDASGRDAWRDHVVYGVNRSEWPARPYTVHRYDAPVAIVAAEGETLGPIDVAVARELAGEIGVPVLRGDAVEELDALWARIEDAVTGAVVLLPAARAAELAHAGGLPLVPTRALLTARDIVRVALDIRAQAHDRPRHA